MNKQKIKNFILKSKVFENYFFMTSLQIFSSLIGIFIYPYLIRVLGKESYGTYVFALSVTSFFVIFISFGFNLPGVKKIVENKDDLLAKNRIVSSVFTAKFYLVLISSFIFTLLYSFIPIIHNNILIFFICYTQILSELFFPIWYFQAMQKMKIATFIQLGFRLLTIPFIFIFIKRPEDNSIYALIVSLSIVLGGLTSVLLLRKKEGIILKLVPLSSLKSYFNDALPFFWSSAAGTIKQESVTIIIGSFFGMADVALYDLANKIILIPRMLTTSINTALFPKVVEKNEKSFIKKILKYESWIGIAVMLAVVAFGYWVILLLGGKTMLASYPLSIILSSTVLTWLVVGSYINFIFVPQNRYYFVTRNQLVAFVSFLLFCAIGILISQSIFTIVISYALSGFCEIIYCNYLIKKHKLL